MISKITTGLVVLVLLFSSLELSARENHKRSKPNHKLIDQRQIDKACGTLILRESGEYRLKENVVGTIVIAASSLCLDLACHTLDAGGAANAIIIQGSPLTGSAQARSANQKDSYIHISNLQEFKKNRNPFSLSNEYVNTENAVTINRPEFRTVRKADDISFSNKYHVKISNGTIIGSIDAGILVDTCFDVSLFDLTMFNNALDAIRVLNSNAVKVSNVNSVGLDSLGNPIGERALLFDSSDNIAVNNVVATNYLSKVGAIIELDSCNAVSMNNVDVTNNTKTATADVFFFDMGTAFVGVQSCTGVDFVRVKVNNNTISNTVPVDPTVNFRTFEAIEFIFCSSCSMHRCETNNNADIAGAMTNEDTEDYIMCFLFCDSCIVTEHQSNNNSCTKPIAFFQAIAIFDSTSMLLNRCQANANAVSELIVAPFVALSGGFIFSNYFLNERPLTNVLQNSQANFNTVGIGGINNALIGMHMHAFGVVDNCEASNNSMADAPDFSGVFGILATTASSNIPDSTSGNATITNSSFCNNSGGSESIGMLIVEGSALSSNIAAINCTTCSNGTSGISIGFGLIEDAPGGGGANVVIRDGISNKNGSARGLSAGIIIQPKELGTRNVFIKGYQINDTFSGGSDIAGIIAINAKNVVIEDTNVFNTTSAGFAAHGILFDTLTDSRIIRTQVHGNQNAGVELIGSNDTISIIESTAKSNDIGFEFAAGSTASCCLVQDSRALNNKTAGFVHATTPLTTTFIGNEAQCNGTKAEDNYVIADPAHNAINLQELAWNDGSLITISPRLDNRAGKRHKKDSCKGGVAACGARFTNLRAVREHAKNPCR